MKNNRPDVDIVYNFRGPDYIAATLLASALNKTNQHYCLRPYHYFNDYVEDFFGDLPQSIVVIGLSVNIKHLPMIPNPVELMILNPFQKKVPKESTISYNNWTIMIKDNKQVQDLTVLDLVNPNNQIYLSYQPVTVKLNDGLRFFEYLPKQSPLYGLNQNQLAAYYNSLFMAPLYNDVSYSVSDSRLQIDFHSDIDMVTLPEYQWFKFKNKNILLADNGVNYELSRLIPNAVMADAIITIQTGINYPTVARFLNRNGNSAQDFLKSYKFEINSEMESTKVGFTTSKLNWASLLNLIQNE